MRSIDKVNNDYILMLLGYLDFVVSNHEFCEMPTNHCESCGKDHSEHCSSEVPLSEKCEGCAVYDSIVSILKEEGVR